MNEDKLERVLPRMFRHVKIPQQAKEELKKRLFDAAELPDDDLSFVAAAGEEREAHEKQIKQEETNHGKV